ncbi:MAG: uroporphyrinogen decarboxylase family protein [Anaerolineae bacterium]
MAEKMTVKERLWAAIQGRDVDRVPVWPYGVYPLNASHWVTGDPSFAPLVALARERADLFATWGVPAGPLYTGTEGDVHEEVQTWAEDGLSVWRYTLQLPKGTLTRVMKGTAGNRWDTKYFVESDDDLDVLLSLPQTLPHPDAGGFHAWADSVGERAAITTTLGSPLGLIAPLFPPELLGLYVATQPDVIQKLVADASERITAHVRALLDQGVRAVFWSVGSEYATPPMMSPTWFRRLVADVDGPLIRMVQAAGSAVVVHCHGNMRAVLPDFVHMDMNALHPIEEPPMGDVTLTEARAALGERCIVGNVQIGDIYAETPAHVAAQVRRLVAEAGPRSLVVTTTASPYETPLKPEVLRNYEALIGAANPRAR